MNATPGQNLNVKNGVIMPNSDEKAEDKKTPNLVPKWGEKTVDPTVDENGFKIGSKIPFSHNIEYSWKSLFYAPNKSEFRNFIEAVPSKLRTAEDKKNLKTVKQKGLFRRDIDQFDTSKTGGIIRNAFGKALGRNDLCPCGSGKKYKKCHLGHIPEYDTKEFVAKRKAAEKEQKAQIAQKAQSVNKTESKKVKDE